MAVGMKGKHAEDDCKQRRGLNRQEAVNWLTKFLVKMREYDDHLTEEVAKNTMTTTAEHQQNSNTDIDKVKKMEIEHTVEKDNEDGDGSEEDSDDDWDDRQDLFIFDDSAEFQLHDIHMLQFTSIDLRNDLINKRPPSKCHRYEAEMEPHQINNALRNLHLKDEAGPSHKRVKKGRDHP